MNSTPGNLRSGRVRQIAARFFRSTFRISIAVIVGLAIYLRLFENRLIFYPERQEAGAPHVAYQDVRFPALDGTSLHGWFIPFNGSDNVFIISHGNAGNIGDRYEMGEWVNAEFRSNVLMYDYRGYGKSEGQPSEAGLYSDLKGALTFVHQRGYSSSKIYLIGQSLGTAVTIDAAAEEPVCGVILEAAFPSTRALARWYLHPLPIDYLLPNRFDSLAKISKVHNPLVVVHAMRDPVIPFPFGKQLFDAATGPKQFFAVDGELHEGAMMGLGLERIREIRDFLSRCKAI